MEFLHGALRSKNKNACFFIRSPESLNSIPAEYNEKFFETEYILKNDWRFFISCKGAIFNRINVLKNLSFKYL